MAALPAEDLALTEKQFGKWRAGISVTGSSLTQLMLPLLLVSEQNLATAKEEGAYFKKVAERLAKSLGF